MPSMLENPNLKFILMDIEGTTSDIHFVKNVLFPYSAKELPTFLRDQQNDPIVKACIVQTGQPDLDLAIKKFHEWITQDIKHPALKTLQGMIWKKGFESKLFYSHIYSDVLPAWIKWKNQGLKLGIFSSGSVEAQKLLFKHSAEGDLSAFLTAYFDLEVGSKREPRSYTTIAKNLMIDPDQILFLSDIPEELDAAKSTGYNVVHIVRPGTTPSLNHRSLPNFSSL